MRISHPYVAFLFALFQSAVNVPAEINYLDCPSPPDDKAVLFAPDLVSLKDRWEEKICFTADGAQVFYGVHPDPNDYFKPQILTQSFADGAWSPPQPIAFAPNRLVG